MTTQGTDALLALADDLESTAPHVAEVYDLRKGSRLMQQAAEAIRRLAHLEPDIEVTQGEN